MDDKQITELLKSDDFELIQTHISWLLLDKKNVYKIKKPVKFSFLDFSDSEKRKFFCNEEVRLNSRLSPDVYLGVVPITKSVGSIKVDADGSEIDYAVKMARLPQDKIMATLLKEDKITPSHVKKIAKLVAEFHKKAGVVQGNFNSPKMIADQIGDLGNFREVIEKASGLGEWVDSILSRSADFIRRNDAMIKKRSINGFVRDAHGDLHSGNVFLHDGIKIIDCIEFSRDFRCVDVISDIAFMAMDLDYSGRNDLSDSFVEGYNFGTEDEDAEVLLPFYKCYRANVRAKIAAIEWMQKPSDETREKIDRYVLLAERYAKRL